MLFRSGSVIALASIALVTACGGSDGDGNEAQTAAPAAATSDDTSQNAMSSDQASDVTDASDEHTSEDADHDHSGDDQNHSDEEPSERLGSHQHGHAMLALTVQSDMISVSFDAPLASMGAPENPQTDEDRAKIQAVQDTFATEANIFSFSGDAGCDLVSKSISTRLTGGHGELQASYDYQCSKVDALEGIRVEAFTTYPALSEVEAVFVSDTQQDSAELTAGSPELTIG